MSAVDSTVFAGRYRVLRRLGAGGGGAVFLARDERLARDVAIKRIHGAEVTAVTAQRLQREARIMASLRHPGLVTVFDMVTEGDELLLVMEYVRGETLADVLADAPLDWGRVAAPLDQIAAALDYVHGRGVVHRDLKPSNVLVGTHGAVKIADLGLATAAEITNITPPGTILGTPAYMAPEQAHAAAPCTPAVDIYALATIAFQALSGTLPRPGSTVLAILRQAEREPQPDLRDRRPGTPAAAAEALMRAMSPRAEDRHASASELLHELHSAFRGAPAPTSLPDPPPGLVSGTVEAEPSRPSASAAQRPAPRPRRRRSIALILAALALGVAGALALVALPDRQRTAQSPPPAASRPTATPTAEPAATVTHVRPKRLSPTTTVRSFYRRAAAGDFKGAWRLAGPGMRGAFGNSFTQFRSDLSSLRHIEFRRVAITRRDAASVTVEIETVATHVDHVDRCSGTLRTVRASARRWVVEPAGVHCLSG